MAISRAQLAKELEPGLNALFGLEYDRYENEHSEIFEEESSDRAFEEEVMLGGFSTAPVKSEGGAISFDDAKETLGVGIVIEQRTQLPEWGDPAGMPTLMYRVMWSGTNTKRWEFPSDLLKVVDK